MHHEFSSNIHILCQLFNFVRKLRWCRVNPELLAHWSNNKKQSPTRLWSLNWCNNQSWQTHYYCHYSSLFWILRHFVCYAVCIVFVKTPENIQFSEVIRFWISHHCRIISPGIFLIIWNKKAYKGSRVFHIVKINRQKQAWKSLNTQVYCLFRVV